MGKTIAIKGFGMPSCCMNCEMFDGEYGNCNIIGDTQDSEYQWDENRPFDCPLVEAIPKEEVRQFIENIQKIKDNHNEHGEPINYGTICGILIEGYRLLDKYREDKDGNDD